MRCFDCRVHLVTMMKILPLSEIYFFCHVRINKDIKAGNNIVEIPPAIADRLLYQTNLLIICSTGFNSRLTSNTAAGIRKESDDKPCFLICATDLSPLSQSHIIGFYLLKDI